jgi:hypothetical protein
MMGLMSWRKSPPRPFGPDELAQITAASIVPVLDKSTGLTKRVWKKTGDDHLLDCDVYQLALWDCLALDRHGPDDWAKIRTARETVAGGAQGDLFGMGAPVPIALPAHDLDDSGNLNTASVRPPPMAARDPVPVGNMPPPIVSNAPRDQARAGGGFDGW